MALTWLPVMRTDRHRPAVLSGERPDHHHLYQRAFFLYKTSHAALLASHSSTWAGDVPCLVNDRGEWTGWGNDLTGVTGTGQRRSREVKYAWRGNGNDMLLTQELFTFK